MVICARMTNQFLQFTKSRGNDLITPNHNYDFPGAKLPGNASTAWGRREPRDPGIFDTDESRSCRRRLLVYLYIEMDRSTLYRSTSLRAIRNIEKI
jgi:uncharacterized protein (DUF2237 family)